MGGFSNTALLTCALRAMETDKPVALRLFEDPCASLFCGQEGRQLAMRMLEKVPGLGLLVALRTRYFDDFLKKGLSRGVTQLVIFGAGLDSRTLRFSDLLKGKKVIEVDHPEQSPLKQRLYAQVSAPLPDLAFIPADLTRVSQKQLEELFRSQGYSSGAKSLFLLEGLVHYIGGPAVEMLFDFMRECSGPGSSFIFNYMQLEKHDKAFQEVTEEIAKMGEPLFFGFDPSQIHDILLSKGFHKVINLSILQIKEALQPSSDLPLPANYYIVSAERL